MVAGEREVTGYIICEVTDLIIVAQHELTSLVYHLCVVLFR